MWISSFIRWTENQFVIVAHRKRFFTWTLTLNITDELRIRSKPTKSSNFLSSFLKQIYAQRKFANQSIVQRQFFARRKPFSFSSHFLVSETWKEISWGIDLKSPVAINDKMKNVIMVMIDRQQRQMSSTFYFTFRLKCIRSLIFTCEKKKKKCGHP